MSLKRRAVKICDTQWIYAILRQKRTEEVTNLKLCGEIKEAMLVVISQHREWHVLVMFGQSNMRYETVALCKTKLGSSVHQGQYSAHNGNMYPGGKTH